MRNPWVGLRPFGVDEASLFFGRDDEVQILDNLVATLPTLIVYAPSGTGKSSLLNAGLMPRLRDDPEQVAVLVRDPYDDVLACTRKALSAAGWEPPSGLGLVETLQRHWLDTDRRTVVVVDQFEERFTAGTEVDDLFTEMSKLTHSRDDAACIVLSLREDYLGNLEPLMQRVPSVLNGSYRVPPLTRQALERAVYGPVETVGAAVDVESALVRRVLDDLDERLGGSRDPGEQRFEPGYFQIVWSTLWGEVDIRGGTLGVGVYETLGGASRILKDFTARILDDLDPAQTSMFWSVSRYLVLPTGAKVALTVEDLADLLQPSDYLRPGNTVRSDPEWPGTDTPWLLALSRADLSALLRSLLQRLTSSDAPIFQRVVRLGREEYEILHDLLGKIILEWREEYRERRESEAGAFAVWLGEAVSDEGWGRDDAEPDEHTTRVATAITTTVGSLRRTLGPRMDENALGRVVGEVRRLLVLLHIAETREFKTTVSDYPLSRNATARRTGVQQVTVQLVRTALDHRSPRVRRALQDLLDHLSVDAWPLRKAPVGPLTVVASCAAGAVLAAASVAVAYLLFAGAIADLGIQYPFLVLGHLLVVAGVVYGSMAAAFEGGVARRALATAVPSTDELSAGRVAITWPLPTVVTVGGAVGGAWLFDAAGWSASAGFAAGSLYMAIAVVVGGAIISIP